MSSMNFDVDDLLAKEVHVETDDGRLVKGKLRFSERLGGVNEIRLATREEIEESVGVHRGVDYENDGASCDGLVFLDEDCYPYYSRQCAICGRGLGLI